MNAGLGGGGGGGGGGQSVTAGPDLEEVHTEQLAFQSVSGESALQLLPGPWPKENPPPTTASLLSVASKRELVAAASPDTLVLAGTANARKALTEGPTPNKVKPFAPQATISIPRCSQLAFSSDESCLVISADQGGGLAVYDVDSLINGGREPAFELSTNGQSVRQLVPNPNSKPDTSRLFGVVTTNGTFHLVDLKERKLVQNSSGSFALHENVSCACWSRLGKQIVAGLGNGTGVQIDQQGVVKAVIPEPPQLGESKDPNALGYPITAVFWLETHEFLVVHTPLNPPDTMGQDDSLYHIARRDRANPSAWIFEKILDPCPPFGAERKPAHHFIQRLREWPPNLSDMLILSSTASTDIGMFSRFQGAT